MISLIASIGKNNEIGKNGDLVWHIKEDMKFFKNTTINHIVVMGFNTYKSLPGPLKDREMIVLSKHNNIDGIKIIRNYKEIVDKYKDSEIEVFIIGGATLYEIYMEYAKRMYLTEMTGMMKYYRKMSIIKLNIKYINMKEKTILKVNSFFIHL